MSPQLALIVFLLFIIIIIIVEHRQTKDISNSIWIPTLWLLRTCSKDLSYYLNVKVTMEEGSIPDRIFLLVLFFVGLIIIKKRAFSLTQVMRRNFLLILVLAFMLVSLMWSQFPALTFRRWFKEVISIFIIFIILTEKDPLEALISAFRKVLYISLPISLMLIKYYPDYGRSYHISTGELMWNGIAGQKNGLALLCSFAIIFFFWSIWKEFETLKIFKYKLRIVVDSFMLLLSIYLMMGPRSSLVYSATSFLSLIIGLIVMATLKIVATKTGQIKQKIIGGTLIVLIFIGSIMPFIGRLPIRQIPELVGRDETLTARVYTWNVLKSFATKKILLGYGFGGFWSTQLREKINVSAHNGYLDVILEIGIIGLIIISIYFISAAVDSAKKAKSDLYISIFFISIVFMFVVHNMAESSIGYITSFPTSLIVSLSIINRENTIIKYG